MTFHLPQLALQEEQVESLPHTEVKPFEMDMLPETRCSVFLELAHLVASQSSISTAKSRTAKKRGKESTTESHMNGERDGNEICRIQRDRTLLSNGRRIP
jgi:hypothetical protein